MATKRMLVDASHPEETRIVVTSGNRLDEFDFESANKRQLRGNIYLAKVTRVEPSLQAAFVDYGGNRHGFLAFSEIHPDYYQIPVADREAILRAEAEAVRQEAVRQEAEPAPETPETDKAEKSSEDQGVDEAEASEADDETPPADEATTESESTETESNASSPDDESSSENQPSETAETEVTDESEVQSTNGNTDNNFEDLGGGEGDDLLEQRRKLTRRYKIQEVIKRRQVLLVQVVKEERGNKGAALTTYLSLAGRYSVLMPNTARGGGISRKITSAADRKRLKQIASDLEVPAGMGVILRTAGASRTKAEIKRDFEYLSRLWENVRQLTLESAAPSLVYEEGSLIKRTIRDLYNKDIGEVLVAGDEAYREAKDFMRLIMPSHAKAVQAYKEDQHLFTRFNVESQLDSMFSPQVTLPSGGYLVINPTEALVSVDVNSGRSTKEHNIEDTALQTNLEAADEVARQLRLRDLAGLIVIDFIDMTERRSIRNVEKRMKDALKNDRARIQVGRISHFGLLEMSRQRMRFGVLESSTSACPNCEGTGIVRAVESSALMVMRAVEDHVMRRPGQSVEVRMTSDVALYILNAKRVLLTELETRLNLIITISADHAMSGSQFSIDRSDARPVQSTGSRAVVSMENTQIDAVSETEDTAVESETGESRDNKERSPRKRRRRKSNNAQNQDIAKSTDSSEQGEGEEQVSASAETNGDGDSDDQPRKRRRRGRRGGRRNRRGPANGAEDTNVEASSESEELNGAEAATPAKEDDGATAATPAAKDDKQDASSDAASADAPSPGGNSTDAESNADEAPKKPARRRTRKSTKPKTESNDSPQSASAEKGEQPAPEVPPAIAAQKAEQPTISNDQAKSEPSGNGDARPVRAVKPVPEEGVIVATSSDEKAEKPKRRGWWSLK